MEMVKLEPHEELKARGIVEIFDDRLGNAGFVSHQWVAQDHPDPDFKQMQVLKDAMKHVLTSQGVVPLDFVTETCIPTAKSIPFQEFQSKPLFLWYDYFSVPQLEKLEGYISAGEGGNNQVKAINSIPAYIAKCRYFFALCPTLDCHAEGRVLNGTTWSRRGWCRLERASRELSQHDTWVLIQGSTTLRVVGTALSFVTGPVGEGEFSVEGDRAKLAAVMMTIVKRKLLLSLQAGDLSSYRRHLNLQSVHLRGFNMEGVVDIVPDKPGSGADDVVAHFLHRMGLRSVDHKDAAGWRPLHYAALSGNLQLIEALLKQRADPNRRTSKDEPKLGFPPWVSPLDLAVFYRHNDAARLLIASKASVRGGILTAMQHACMSDNAEGIRFLSKNDRKSLGRNLFGATALEVAGSYGAWEAMEELLRQVRFGRLEISGALHAAMILHGGSARMVERLVSLRADVNFQYHPHRNLSRLGRVIFGGKSLQHRFGRATVLSEVAYHSYGCTPLMATLQTAQYEGAAALIAAGARLDIRNCRGFTAADFARGQPIPEFLQAGLAGDPEECERVTSLALSEDYFEI
ncbi:ASB3 [Symbiodinium natans]|uniref:ASB3 protein n=1 Tax=Symbiodinium natans TaxID=878477 RepID=A0A812PIV9_9DINO|nr:ASB3 [Symbiodinium natans]